MSDKRATQRIVDACVGMGRYQPHELLTWMVADVLAGFGVRCGETPPADLRAWLLDASGEYARAVAARPFEDVLGEVYQSLASRGHRGGLGQFFTPSPVAEFMARLVTPTDLPDRHPDRLLRMCEPACGSGALILAFMRGVVESKGADSLRRWSITAIDLDHLCAKVCATQMLANLCLGRLDLGELVIYRGNALGATENLQVVVHATSRDQTPDVVLPALHPSRLHALRQAAASVGKETDEGCGARGTAAQEPMQAKERARTVGSAAPTATVDQSKDESQIDLFAE